MIKFIKYCCFILPFLTSVSSAQTGINTGNPAPSSVLDVTATDKGVLLPQYTLTSLISAGSPVSNPVESSLIFNTGGTYPKGYYYWTGSSWDRLVINDEMDQILKLQIANNSTAVIPSGIGDNYAKFETTGMINAIAGASINTTNQQEITLPKGTYRVDITFDCRSDASTDPGTAFLTDNNLFCVNATLVKSAGNSPLFERKLASVVSGRGVTSIQGFKYSFVVTLASADTIKLLLAHDDGASSTVATQANQAGLVVTFYKFFE